jgi:hypothetical protein
MKKKKIISHIRNKNLILKPKVLFMTKLQQQTLEQTKDSLMDQIRINFDSKEFQLLIAVAGAALNSLYDEAIKLNLAKKNKLTARKRQLINHKEIGLSSIN